MRVKESTQGVYDIQRLYEDACDKKRRLLDVANYLGPINISQIPNKGRGFVASEDIAKGTLLLAETAYSCGYDDEITGLLVCFNTITNHGQDASRLLTVIRAINNLRYDPSKAKELYSLYAGDSLLSEQHYSEGLEFIIFLLFCGILMKNARVEAWLEKFFIQYK